MSGRSSISYRALSRCLVSLASAGSVCCAKPNHGFSGCQQASATFSRRLPRTLKRTAFPLHRACVSHYPAHGHFANTGVATGLCFQCLQRSGQLFTTFLIGYFFATLSSGDLLVRTPEAGLADTGTRAAFRGAQALLRENCADVGGDGPPDRWRSECLFARTNPACTGLHRPKKTGRTWRPVGIETRCELSGRLPRAVRRNRRDRASP